MKNRSISMAKRFSTILLLSLFIFSFANIESAPSFPVKGNEGSGDNQVCESVTHLMENCGGHFYANADTRGDCCRDVNAITGNCPQRNMNHEEIKLISIAKKICSNFDTEFPPKSPPLSSPTEPISPPPSPNNSPKSPSQTPPAAPSLSPASPSPPNQTPPISSSSPQSPPAPPTPPSQTPSLPPKSSPLLPQTPPSPPEISPSSPEQTPLAPSSPPSISLSPPNSSSPPPPPQTPPAPSSPLPQTPSSPPESSPLPPQTSPEASPLPSPPPQPTPDPTPHGKRPANCLVSTVLYDSCDPKYPVASSNGTSDERNYNPENVSTGFMTDGTGCCLAFAMFTNNCNAAIKDLSFANQKVFDSLQRACTSPFYRP